MERLADFRPHDSFKGLRRSRGSGRLSRVRGRDDPMRVGGKRRRREWVGWGGAVAALHIQNGRRGFAMEWTAWQRAAERSPLCQLLITLIGVIS